MIKLDHLAEHLGRKSFHSTIIYSSLFIPIVEIIQLYYRANTDKHTQQTDCSTWTTNWWIKITINNERSLTSSYSVNMCTHYAGWCNNWVVHSMVNWRDTDSLERDFSVQTHSVIRNNHTTIKIVRLSVTVGDRGKRHAARGWLSSSQQQTLSGRAARVYTCTCVHDNIPCKRLPK